MVSVDIRLGYQLLVSQVSHFILGCRDRWPGTFQAEELEEQLRTGFRLFTEKQGNAPAGELRITCRQDGDAIQVSFCWQPSAQILSSQQEIILEFPW